MAFDYVLPGWLTKILRKPSIRTQIESSMVGILVMMLGSLGISTMLIANGVVEGWMMWLTIFSELGILSFQFSMLSQLYQQYFQYKMSMGLYPLDYELMLKISEAEALKEQLEKIISKNKLNPLIKSKEEVKND